jgi:hypothetical protein
MREGDEGRRDEGGKIGEVPSRQVLSWAQRRLRQPLLSLLGPAEESCLAKRGEQSGWRRDEERRRGGEEHEQGIRWR